MTDAKLYEVVTARGTVYALLDVGSGMVWTERSEQAARQLAKDRRLSITEERAISHEELLRLMGHEPLPKSPATASAHGIESPPVAPEEGRKPGDVGSPFIDAPVPKLSFPVRYYLEDETELPLDDTHVVSRQTTQRANGVFCSDSEITPKVAPDEGCDKTDQNPDRPVSS